MNNQKKIEDILYSIQELILEARNEEKLDKLETQGVVDSKKIEQFKTQSLEKNIDQNKTHLDKIKKTKESVVKNLEINSTKNNSSLTNNWRNLNFEKCQKTHQNVTLKKNNIEIDEVEKLFKESLNFWIKKNLPDLIEQKTALYTKKILEEKLK